MMLRRVLSKCNLSPKTLSQEQQACFFSTSATNQHQLQNQPQPQVVPPVSAHQHQQAQQDFSSNSRVSSAPSSLNTNRAIRSPTSSSSTPVSKETTTTTTTHQFNSLSRLQKQQHFDTSGTTSKVSATAGATATYHNHKEHQAWRIMGQLSSNKVNFFNDSEVQQKVSEACTKAYPNSEEQRRELQAKVLNRIEEKKDLIDPHRRPFLYV